MDGDNTDKHKDAHKYIRMKHTHTQQSVGKDIHTHIPTTSQQEARSRNRNAYVHTHPHASKQTLKHTEEKRREEISTSALSTINCKAFSFTFHMGKVGMSEDGTQHSTILCITSHQVISILLWKCWHVFFPYVKTSQLAALSCVHESNFLFHEKSVVAYILCPSSGFEPGAFRTGIPAEITAPSTTKKKFTQGGRGYYIYFRGYTVYVRLRTHETDSPGTRHSSSIG